MCGSRKGAEVRPSPGKSQVAIYMGSLGILVYERPREAIGLEGAPHGPLR